MIRFINKNRPKGARSRIAAINTGKALSERGYIWYTMDKVSQLTSGTHLLLNENRIGYNANLFSGRHLVLDATQELPIEVPHTLGSDVFTIMSSNLGTQTTITNGYNLTAVGGLTTEYAGFASSITTGLKTVVMIEFTATINSGSLTFANYYDDTLFQQPLPNGNHVVVNGLNRIEAYTRVVNGQANLYPDVTSTFDIDFTNISVKEVTTPVNSGILYWDATANEYVQIGADGVGSSVELVTNGDFNDGLTGWSDPIGVATAAGGVLSYDSTGLGVRADVNASSLPSFVLNRRYAIISKLNSITGKYRVTLAGVADLATHTTAGVKYDYLNLTSSAGTVFRFSDVDAGDTVFDLDYLYAKEALPVSTTYTFTNQSVGEIAPTTKPFDTADIALMNADNQLLGQLALGSTTTGLSLVTADLYGYYPVSELSGAIAYDAPLELGVEKILNPLPSKEDLDGSVSTITAITNGFNFALTTAGTGNRPKLTFTCSAQGEEKSVISFNAVINSGACTIRAILYGGAVVDINYLVVDGYNEIIIDTDTVLTMYFGTVVPQLFDIDFTNMSYKPISSIYSTITNYLSTVRTDGDNSTYGMQLVGFKQDSLGLPTAVADAGTTQWLDDGRHGDIPWTITAPFTITEPCDGVVYSWLSDGTYYADGVYVGTYTVPTGDWIFSGNLAFDGVTTVTARGATKMVKELVIP